MFSADIMMNVDILLFFKYFSIPMHINGNIYIASSHMIWNKYCIVYVLNVYASANSIANLLLFLNRYSKNAIIELYININFSNVAIITNVLMFSLLKNTTKRLSGLTK